MIRGNILVRNNKYDDHRFYHVLWKQQPDDIDTSFDQNHRLGDKIALTVTMTIDSRKPENCILANQGDLLPSDWYALLQTEKILGVIKTRIIA